MDRERSHRDAATAPGRTRRRPVRHGIAPALACVAAIALAAAIGASITPAAASLTERDRKDYELAFRAIDSGHWKAARRHAGRAEETLPRKAVLWLCYQSDSCPASFAEIAAFVRANPDWPRLDRLRRRAELAIDPGTPEPALRAWFAAHPPQTGAGALLYLDALDKRTAADPAVEPALRATARSIWRTTVMSAQEERRFREEYRKLVTRQDEIDRLEMLLWSGHLESASRQAHRVPRARRELAEARIRLRRMAPGVDAAIAKVDESLVDHPGLVYERLRWRRRKDRDDDAFEMLTRAEGEAVRPDLWWRERAILARRAFNDGLISRAYRLAANHRTSEGADFALAEWFAGWIALRYLRDPKLAFPHFRRMHETVSYPVSLSRAAYWAGRAAEAGGKTAIALDWYREAAGHTTSFYGQIAALELPEDQRPHVPLAPSPSVRDARAFGRAELPRLVRMLAATGADNTARVFVHHLAERYSDPANLALLARLAHDIGRTDLAVLTSREAIKDHVVLAAMGYPLGPLEQSRYPDDAVVLGLIRQESGFDATARSSAGARGLMQLMPTTAQVVARRQGVPYSERRLTADPAFNVRLGSAHLVELLERFDGHLPVALAAYNAGPYRVEQWIDTYGDPRRMPFEDQLDWIESIPYPETRNYVQRVLENITVYRQRAAGRHVALRMRASAR